jgi:hypothetical protein
LTPVPIAAEWQVVQEPAGLRVLASNARQYFDEERLVDDVRRALAARGAVVPPVRVQPMEAITRSARGKAPLTTSTIPGDSAVGPTGVRTTALRVVIE